MNGIILSTKDVTKELLTFADARRLMAEALQDEDMRLGYRANIAMKIHDDQNLDGLFHCYVTDEKPLNLKTISGCNEMAERIIDLIFGVD